MYNNKKMRSMIALILLFCIPINAVDWNQIGKLFAGVGTALAAVGAAAIGYEWLTRPSDSEYIIIVDNDIASVVNNNKEFMNIFKTELDWEYCTQQIRQYVLNTLSENCLYAIANLSYAQLGNPFPPALKNDCSALDSHLKELLKRIDALRKERHLSLEQQVNLNKMCALVDQVAQLQEELCLLRDYLEKHSSYFDLAAAGWRSFKNYAADVELYELYKYDQYRFMQQLDVIVYKKYGSYRFPYITYAEDLDQSITILTRAKNRAAYNYTAMLNWIDQYVHQLRAVRYMIDSRYQLQLLERERAYIQARRAQLEETRRALRMQAELDRWEAERREVEQLLDDIAYKITATTQVNPSTQLHVTVQL